METDVCEAERRLDQLFPEQSARSFAYPCYASDVGRGLTRTSYVTVIARQFRAARARCTSIRGNHPRYADLHHLSSWSGERMLAAELIGLVHLLEHLARYRSRFWVALLIEVAQYILQTG